MATILPSNFTSNSLSGSFTVENGLANVTLLTVPYALEGDKPFVIKIRRNSITGDVIATSPPIVLRDASSVVSLTANISSVAEGNLVSFTLVTANATNNANIFYSVFPVTANLTLSDFYGSNVGIATLVNNQATFSLYANTDAGYVNEDGETFKVQIRTNSASGNIVYTSSNVAILDVYKAYNVLGFVESISSVVEGANVTFTITAHNANAGTLYYSTVGNVTNSSFVSGNTGSAVVSGTTATILLQTTSTVPALEERTFQLKLSQISAFGPTIATSNTITIIDSALAYINATGGDLVTVAGGYKTHRFYTSNALVITGIGTPAGRTLDYLVVAGGGGGGSGLYGGGGGGAGGFRTSSVTVTTAGNVTVVVGAGGAQATYTPPGAANMFSGNPSSINAPYVSIDSSGGGHGGGFPVSPSGAGGGSGGGGGHSATYPAGGGTPGQGNPGGILYGGGGGASAPGTNGGAGTVNPKGNGGDGSTTPFTPGEYFAGGGGGGKETMPQPASVGSGGSGGGGPGLSPGTVNTGGGGGGGVQSNPSGAGGSGIVIIRYPYA